MESIAAIDFPLSYGQRYLLYRLLATPQLGRPMQRIYRLTPEFDAVAFGKAMDQVVAIHPALRLRLMQDGDNWWQRFPDQGTTIFSQKVKGLFRSYRSAYADLLIADEAKTVLDLRREPPVKAKIIEVNGERQLSLCVDHIAVDGMGFDLFEQALVTAYQQALGGEALSCPPSPAFCQYLVNEVQDEQLQAENLQYWQQYLQGASIFTKVTVKPAIVTCQLFHYELNGHRYAYLLNSCKKNKISLLHVLIAVQLLLMRESSSRDEIVLSIPISNRSRAEESSIIANLFMPVYVRIPLVSHEPIPKLLLRIRDQLLNAMLHRQYNYPSFDWHLQSEARKQGAVVNFHQACSLIVDPMPLVYPNCLFTERLDNKAEKTNSIYQTSFYITGRQTKEALHVEINWDASTWPITVDFMEEKFLHALERILKYKDAFV